MRPSCLLFAALAALPIASQAQGVRASRPLPGYACAMPNVSEDALHSGVGMPAVLSEPSATAQRIGTSSGIVIVTSPARTMNGYVEMMHLDGRRGWVAATQLRPYRSLSDPNATCTPAIMSDGRPGFR